MEVDKIIVRYFMMFFTEQGKRLKKQPKKSDMFMKRNHGGEYLQEVILKI